MKNTMKLLGTQSQRLRSRSRLCAVVLVALIGFSMAACTLDLGDLAGGLVDDGSGGGSTTSRLSGTYYLNLSGYDWSITFSGSNFTAYAEGESARGTYSISGSSLRLYVDGETAYWTIVDQYTLRDNDGDYWYKY